MEIKDFIKDVPDFPKPGITFKDIQPLLDDPQAFEESIVQMADMLDDFDFDYIAGLESRGFIFGTALAWITNKGFKLIRKAGKLPGDDLVSMEYGLEYGRDKIEMQKGSGKIVLVDDVYATGGTMAAGSILCDLAGYQVVDSLALMDIGIIKKHDVKCLISY